MQRRKINLCALLMLSLSLFTIQAQTVKDIDGNVYKTVKIGTQTWMAENLKTTKFNDGTPIPLVPVYDKWQALSTPAYSWYENNAISKNSYGALYNWYTVNSGKLCPKGWHAPSDTEWTILTNHYGDEYVAGGKLKEAGTSHWQVPNEGATNEGGFTALPGGNRGFNGAFGDQGEFGYWWSSTESNSTEAWYSYIGNNGSWVKVLKSGNKHSGFSVRCVMGPPSTTKAPDAVAKNPLESGTIRNEQYRFEVTAPESWSFSKMVQQDPYEEMKSGKYSFSISTGEGDKVPENWNGFRLNSTGASNDFSPFLIIYAHKVSDQNREEFTKLFELSLTRFGIKEMNLNREFTVGDAKGFDCIYNMGLKVRYTALYRNGIRVVIHYYFPSNDSSLFDKYAPDVDKIIKSLRIK